MVDFYADWVKKYPIRSIEDGMAENDWDGWKLMTDKLGSKIQIVGDDLFVTNTQRIATGHREGLANSVLIKLNQIGSLTETLAAIDMARRAGLHGRRQPPLGRDRGHDHRGPGGRDQRRPDQDRRLCRTDRVAKYNQLLRIEEELGDAALYGSFLWKKA